MFHFSLNNFFNFRFFFFLLNRILSLSVFNRVIFIIKCESLHTITSLL